MGILVIEIGTEALPVEEQKKARVHIEQEWTRSLQSIFETSAPPFHVWSTPHRLVIYSSSFPSLEPEKTIILKGPPARIAFDEENQPTRALLGFVQSHSATVDQVFIEETDKGPYVFLKKTIEGRPVEDFVPEILEPILINIPFRKKMRWPGSDIPFSRPIRWVLAMFDDRVLPWSFAGIEAGSKTYLFTGKSRPISLDLGHAGEYLNKLREHNVLPDPEERRQVFTTQIHDMVRSIMEASGKTLRAGQDDELIDFWVHITESPRLIWGTFDPGFLKIPHIVLITAMRHHQKYLPVYHDDNTLAPYFLTPINTTAENLESIRATHQRVLTARFRDAEFFWNEDRRLDLDHAREMLADVQFLDRGGSYLDKIQRVHELVAMLPEAWERGDDAILNDAIKLYRVDLVTQLVGEFPELEGEVGALLAREAGYSEGVARAIREAVRCQSATDAIPSTSEGQTLAFLDRLDSLLVSLGLGHTPSGSADPLGQRRWVLTLIRILIESHRHLDLDQWTPIVYERIRSFLPDLKPFSDIEKAWIDLIRNRLITYWIDSGFHREHILSFVERRPMDPYDWHLRLKALHAADPGEVYRLGLVYKRLASITRNFHDNQSPDPDLFAQPEETKLYQTYLRLRDDVTSALNERNYARVIQLMAGLSPVLHEYFERVFVMTDDENLRINRLRTLRTVRSLLESFADLDHWSIEVTETF